jgi:uncharacterized protein YndB with AHSA1/START domain
MSDFATIEDNVLEIERHLEAPPARIWSAVTEPEELRAWLARADIDLRVGGRIVLTFENDPNVMEGAITELREGAVIEYTWPEAGTDSIVRFELAPEGSGTRLRLVHTFREVHDLSGYGAGWHHHLELLAAQASGQKRDWDSNRYRELKEEYERRAQQAREAQLKT